jgi:hypothetical protein
VFCCIALREIQTPKARSYNSILSTPTWTT